MQRADDRVARLEARLNAHVKSDAEWKTQADEAVRRLEEGTQEIREDVRNYKAEILAATKDIVDGAQDKPWKTVRLVVMFFVTWEVAKFLMRT